MIRGNGYSCRVINDTLRDGLKHAGAGRRPARSEFHTSTVDLGRCHAANLDDIAEVLAVAESESFR